MTPNNKTIQPGDYVVVKNAANDKDSPAMLGLVLAVTMHNTAIVLWETFIREELSLEILQRIDHGTMP